MSLLYSCDNMKHPVIALFFIACTVPSHKNPPVPAVDSGNSSLSYEVSVEEKEDLELLKLPKIEAYFSPKGGCTDAIDTFISSSKKELDIMAYSFTSLKIVTAIGTKSNTDAGKSIPVIAILDRSDIITPIIGQLENEHVTVYIDEKHVIMHNKFIVRDNEAVETGSFNYTNQAENSNAENCLIIRDKAIATSYAANFQLHLAHSTPAAEAIRKWKQQHTIPTFSKAD